MKHAAAIAGTALIYFLAAKGSLLLAIPPGYATAIWPPSGIALALLLLGGRRLWPGILIGAIAANFTIAQSPASVFIGAGNTLEALAALWLARRLSPDREWPFGSLRQVLQLVFAGCVGSFIAATIAVAALSLGGALADDQLRRTWLTWWLGDVGGIMAVTPLVVAWARPVREVFTGARIVELLAFATAVALLAAFFFLNWMKLARPLPLGFLLLPLVVWAGVRFGEREVTTAILVILGIGIWSTVAGAGPFSALPQNEALLLTQLSMGTLIVAGLAISVTVGALKRTSAALAKAREEMEQFVYVAAHDVQEPLRNVLNFSELLERHLGGGLDAKGREFLGFITGGAARSRRLIEDLLSVSRAGQGRLAPERIELDRVLDDALANLGPAIEAAGAVLTRDPLPRVVADARLLERVLQNLVGNAIRHHGEGIPRIHVAAQRRGAEWDISIKDDGPGIDPRYFEVVFRMFGRLPQALGRDGTGIGLALCRRIVERHGGRIWVESAPGEGAAFHFTLPADDAAERDQ